MEGAIKNKIPGPILNITTTYAFTGSGYVIPSACAKGGISSMTRSIAAEWAKYNIRCNAIAPGPFPTKGAWKRLVPPGLNIEKKMMERVPLKRFGEHDELANLASYLMADESGYMNGEVITMDGGEWLKGAGQFNALEKMPNLAWKAMALARRKKKHSKFRIHFRVTPAALIFFGFIYSLIIHQILKAMFDFIP
jgi:hypothetical protein